MTTVTGRDACDTSLKEPVLYRGRLAPTPSGWLHLGHAATFKTAWERARAHGGSLLYRCENLDPERCQPRYVEGAMEDLRWWGLDWDEGPDCGGPCTPYQQSERLEWYCEVFERLRSGGWIYLSPHSRKQIAASKPLRSPVDGDPLFPPSLRTKEVQLPVGEDPLAQNWRFRVPDGLPIQFWDQRLGEKRFIAGQGFGDFLVWRRIGVPSYELAVVADDHQMAISEVVRGEDLLLSTARQILLYQALGWTPPAWFHCPLVIDPATGHRMSKTNRSMGLRVLRKRNLPPGQPAECYF